MKFGIGNVVAWGDVAACLFMTAFGAHITDNVKVVFAKEFSSNSSQIDLSSLTHSVP